MLYVRMHSGKGDTVLAACDEELLGAVLVGDGLRLEVSEAFYRGELVSEEVLAERMRSASVMNLTGDAAVAVAVREGYVDERNVAVVGGVRHAQAVRR